MRYKAVYKKRSVSPARGWTEFSETLDRRDLNDLLRFIETSEGRYMLVSIIPHTVVKSSNPARK